MSLELWAFIIALILDAVLILMIVWHIIAFDELKTDFKNPVDLCNNLNPLILPEYGIHLFFCFFFLVDGQIFALLINLPVIIYNIYRYANRPFMTGPGLYDPTTVMNSTELAKHQKEGWAKLIFFILCFFYYLYRQDDLCTSFAKLYFLKIDE
ncbi:Protein cornichon-like protein 1 [Trichoplax sp. H2]|nr:Protein cornichon-like protein 1 [Trichoplax sp. H2]|eukprot:RDD40240.1 Protein cornichon-like protein 1 [Trichoplax sp. H2]